MVRFIRKISWDGFYLHTDCLIAKSANQNLTVRLPFRVNVIPRFRIASRVEMKSYPEYYEQQRPETETSRAHTSKIDQHRAGAVD